jgi:NitT/TauT family transport system ATP-binding protein
MTSLRLVDVKRTFAGRAALDGVSLEIPAGQFTSLLGASGCGKSTLLRLVSGLDVPTSGRIELSPPLQSPPGFVFQDAALMPWASVRRNVELPLTLRGVSTKQRLARVDAALHTVGLSDVADAVPRELSGGMRMRVSLARVLVTTPRLWLLDEPFGALDEITRFALNQMLLSLCQPEDDSPPATALFVTHSVYEAVFLSQRIAVMARPGRIVDEIAIDEPYPRSAAFRTTPRFTAWCAQVSDALQRANVGVAT